jgi:hypothetical protein
VDPIDWLLDADPAIRWQAMRDLTDASPAEIRAARARVPREGLGADILGRQGPDGAWRLGQGPVWKPTLFTLLLLRATGIDRADPAVESAVARLEAGLGFDNRDGCWELRPVASGATPFFDGEVEPCINGGVLALGGYFGRPAERLARRLVGEQLEDGGWNCDAPPSTRGSFHTTICVLEGLLEYERAVGAGGGGGGGGGAAPEVAAARRRGEEYLLARGLFRRRSTGKVADPAFLELAFPPGYRYDILRALDYFRAAGAEPDARMGDAVQIIESRRQPDGRWLLDRAYDAVVAVPAGDVVGGPSRWNTLRARRVLAWYQA